MFFERHFDSDHQNNVILASLINCHYPDRTFSREPNIHSEVLSLMLKSFPSTFLSIRSTVQQKVDKINSLLICLRGMHFLGMAARF